MGKGPFKMKGFSPFTKNGDVDIHKLKDEYDALIDARKNMPSSKERAKIDLAMQKISEKIKKMHPKEFK